LTQEEINSINGGKFIEDCELRRKFTELKQQPEYSWLYKMNNNITKQAIKDACNAYKKFFKNKVGKPKFKSRRKTKPSFYNDCLKLKFKKDKVLIQKIGWIRISEPERVTAFVFSNPRIKHDGKYWYISIGVEIEAQTVDLTDESLGVSVGINNLAVCSNNYIAKNINRDKKVKKQKKKLRRLQRRVLRKYRKYKKGVKIKKTSNIIKLEKKITLLYRKIANIRINHIHQTTAAIVKTKPSRVVTENLNIKKLMKNRHLSKSIKEQGLYNFKTILKYKCKFYGIEFVEVDPSYQSLIKCVVCGNTKKDLKLSEKPDKCRVCGNTIDKNYQIALNLSNYRIS